MSKCTICSGTEQHTDKCPIPFLIAKIENRLSAVENELIQEIQNTFSKEI